MLVHPSPPKREEDLAEDLEMWQDKMRRVEAHGGEFKLSFIVRDQRAADVGGGRTEGVRTLTCGG